MSMLQESPPYLLSLPNELLTKICIYAADNESYTRGKDLLRAVRLTCKQLYIPATEELAKRFFRSPAFMASRQSLQKLVALCKHTLIGPYIQEIVFHPCRLNKNFLNTIKERMRFLTPRLDAGAIAEAQRHIQWYSAKLEDEISLKDLGDAKMFFEQAFGALQVYHKPIKLTTTTTKSLDVMFIPSEWGSSRPTIREFISFWKSSYVHGSGLTFLSAIFEAAITAGSQIHNLEVKVETMNGSVLSIDTIKLSWQTLQAFARLKRLEVDLGEPFSDGAVEKTLVRIVANAKGLVGIVFFSNSEYVRFARSMPCYISRLVGVLHSRALRQMWLRDIVLHSRDLLMMLRKHKDTLKELAISNVLLLGSWDEVLLAIRDDLRLNTLVMINLSTITEYEYRNQGLRKKDIKYLLRGGVELSGDGAVSSGVDEVLNKWNRQKENPFYNPGWRSATDMSHLAYPKD
jgi:hypothetical protein